MATDDKVNINTATREELADIPGSSKDCADAVVRLREQRGGLRSVDEIDDITGFGAEAMRQFKARCVV